MNFTCQDFPRLDLRRFTLLFSKMDFKGRVKKTCHVLGFSGLDLSPIYTAIHQNGFHVIVQSRSEADLECYSLKWISRVRIVPTRSEPDLHCYSPKWISRVGLKNLPRVRIFRSRSEPIYSAILQNGFQG